MNTNQFCSLFGFLCAVTLSTQAQNPPGAEPSTVQFSSAAFSVGEQDGVATIRVVLTTSPEMGEAQVK